MTNQIAIAVVFIFFLLVFGAVGIYAAKYQEDSTTDYLLASRNVNRWLTALAAQSTGQSGLLFTGQVGFAYLIGISSAWLTIGWAIGDYIAWWFAFKRLRQLSEEADSETVSDFLGQETKGFRWITVVSALITIAFLGSYAAAQLVAGGKALNMVFGWSYEWGIIVGAVIVGMYCFSGGIRASIWTDAAQSIVMIGSLLLVVIVAIASCGGPGGMWMKLREIDPNLVSLTPSNLKWGFLPFLLGWIGAGFGVVGQPHIVIQAMVIDSPNNIGFARDVKTFFGLINSFSVLGVGLAARVLLPDLASQGDPELALFVLTEKLLPMGFVGVMLAGLFAATMSTADSQILSCSAAITQDIFPRTTNAFKYAKIGTLTLSVIVLCIALAGDKNVFTLVTFSWSALASGLGALLVVRVWRKPVSAPVAIAMMIVGIATALTWNLGLKLSSAVYEVLPGMAASFAVYLAAQLFAKNKLA